MIAAFVPGLLWIYGECYYAQTSYPLELRGLEGRFLPIELIAPGRAATVEPSGLPLLNREQFLISAIQAPRDGADLVRRLPAIMRAMMKLFESRRHRWPLMIIYDAGLLSQAAAMLCWRFRIPFVLRIGGDALRSTRARLKYRPGRVGNAARLGLAFQSELALKLMLRGSCGTVVTDADLAARYRRFSPHVREFIAVNTSLNDIEPELPRSRLQGWNGLLKILAVGRVTPVKGLEHLVAAAGLLRRAGVPLQVTIVGPLDEPEYLNFLKDKANALGMREQVRFTGRVAHGHQLWEHYRGADVFVLPSLSEGTPNVISEAMAKGLPIIASNVGGIPRVVRHGVNGVLVGHGRPEPLADALGSIAADSQRRYTMGLASVSMAPEFTMERQINPVFGWALERARSR